MFNLGPGEVVVMALLAFIFVGSLAPIAPVVSRWSWSDWLRVCAAAGAIGAAVALR